MKQSKAIQIIGLVITIPLAVFAVHENYWAEPLPPEKPVPVVVIEAEPAYTELKAELPVQTIAEGQQVEDLELIARCVEAEAGNQSLLGKRLVADVILNRAEHPEFPDGIREVIYQPGQFSVVDNGAIDSVVASAETREAVLRETTAERVDENILYFQTGYYGSYGEPWEHVGDHYFSTGRTE